MTDLNFGLRDGNILPKGTTFEPLGKPKLHLPGAPKEPKIMAKYPKIESIGSIGSITLAILEVHLST